MATQRKTRRKRLVLEGGKLKLPPTDKTGKTNVARLPVYRGQQLDHQPRGGIQWLRVPGIGAGHVYAKPLVDEVRA